MNKKELENKIKYDMTNESSPDLQQIMQKTDSLREHNLTLQNNEITIVSNHRNTKNILVIFISILIFVLTIFFVFTYGKIINDTTRYCDSGSIKWNFNISVDSYNEKYNTSFKQFHGIPYGTMASAIGIKHYLWVEYQYLSEEDYESLDISLRATTNNVFPREYLSVKDYEDTATINGLNLKYKKYFEELDDVENFIFYHYIIYIFDKGYNYIIYITDMHDRNLEYYLNMFY